MALYALKTGARVPWREALETWIGLHAAGTARNYQLCLSQFERFSEKDFMETTETDALRYAEWLGKRRGVTSRVDPTDTLVSRATVKAKLVLLRCLSDHLITTGFSTQNPFRGACQLFGKAEAGSKCPTDALRDDDVRRLLNAPGGGKQGLRNKALLSLLFGGGMRIGEALGLNLGDICESSAGTTYLRLRRTKAGHSQSHALQDWVAEAVLALRAQRRSEGARESDPLLVVYYASGEPKNKRVQYSTFRRWWVALLADAGLPATITSHWGRATAITKLLSDNCTLREVQEFSRHSSAHTVEIYDKRRFTIDSAVQKKLRY